LIRKSVKIVQVRLQKSMQTTSYHPSRHRHRLGYDTYRLQSRRNKRSLLMGPLLLGGDVAKTWRAAIRN
jgi:hypothetical protein